MSKGEAILNKPGPLNMEGTIFGPSVMRGVKTRARMGNRETAFEKTNCGEGCTALAEEGMGSLSQPWLAAALGPKWAI